MIWTRKPTCDTSLSVLRHSRAIASRSSCRGASRQSWLHAHRPREPAATRWSVWRIASAHQRWRAGYGRSDRGNTSRRGCDHGKGHAGRPYVTKGGNLAGAVAAARYHRRAGRGRKPHYQRPPCIDTPPCHRASLETDTSELGLHQTHYIIRRISLGEGEMLRDVRLRALSDSPDSFCSTFEAENRRPQRVWADDASDRAQGNQATTFFALIERQCVGLASGGRSEEYSGVELFSMWVAPTCRGLGLGKRLVQAVEDWARSCGDERVWLWVTRGNGPATHLYERMGFVAKGVYKPLPSDPQKELTLLVHTLQRDDHD
jgi:GNAT superfamily N-acetyltransferase